MCLNQSQNRYETRDVMFVGGLGRWVVAYFDEIVVVYDGCGGVFIHW
jgi:hypothetical protein